MLQAERLEKILQYVNEKGFVKNSDLMEMFQVSKPTIIRDLLKLESQNLIVRTHGGATSIKKGTRFEPRHTIKENQSTHKKEKIALLAKKLIHPGETILLDSGSTTYALAKQLLTVKNVTIITNDINIAMCLSKNEEIELVVLGGQKRSGVYSLVGPFTEEALRNLYVDKVFLGADAVDVNRGITNSNIDEINIKKMMIAIAKETILLADSSKFNNVAFSKIADIDALDVIITDREIYEKHVLEALSDRNITIHIAE